MAEGFVYLLRNEAMPGFVKIGLTELSVEQRIRQLNNNTSVPLPFEEYFAARVPDCQRLERTLHFVFGEKRVNPNREFFRIDPDLAKAIIELVAIQELPTVTDHELPAQVKVEIEATRRARGQRSSFDRLGLKPGAELTFSKDPGVTCVITGPRTVMFEGEELSPSAAALRAINAMGYNWSTVSGYEYWTYLGHKLVDLAPSIEASETDEEPPAWSS
jgi:hypothetical protein